MTGGLLYYLDHLTADEVPSIADLGGETEVFAVGQALIDDPRLPVVVQTVCNEWSRLADREAATRFIVDSVTTKNLFALQELLEIVLSSVDVVPAIANPLQLGLKARAGTSVAGQIVLEAWTRLALGDWSGRTLDLRAQLTEVSSTVADDATQHLTRSLGAALSRWEESELEDALVDLTENYAVRGDAAFELGLNSLRKSAMAGDAVVAGDRLADAVKWLEIANEDDRSDASAFLCVARQVLDFHHGRPITQTGIDAAADAVFTYLDGYRGLGRHWREPQADSSLAWLTLVTRLRNASGVDEPARWLHASDLIDGLAAAYVSHRTLALVIKPDALAGSVARASTDQPGILALMAPRISRSLVSRAAAAELLDVWLAEHEDQPFTGEVEAIQVVRKQLYETGVPRPKDDSGSGATDVLSRIWPRGQDTILPTGSTETLPAELASEFALVSELHQSSYAQERLVERITSEVDHVMGGPQPYNTELRAALTMVVRFIAFHLDEAQNQKRTTPWLRSDAPWPEEHEIADDLNRALRLVGFNSWVEVPNVAGGRVDIIIQFQRCRLIIEAKRIARSLGNDKIVEKYGDQAVQYAATDIPVAMLLVADYSRRSTRIDLDGCFWTTSHQVTTGSRTAALIGVRAQANVAPPSASSR